MGKLTVNPSPYTIINAYGNAPMASGYYVGVYLVRNEAKPDNPSPTSEAAYSQVSKGNNHNSY